MWRPFPLSYSEQISGRAGAPRRIRTANLLITSELPYRWAMEALKAPNREIL